MRRPKFRSASRFSINWDNIEETEGFFPLSLSLFQGWGYLEKLLHPERRSLTYGIRIKLRGKPGWTTRVRRIANRKRDSIRTCLSQSGLRALRDLRGGSVNDSNVRGKSGCTTKVTKSTKKSQKRLCRLEMHSIESSRYCRSCFFRSRVSDRISCSGVSHEPFPQPIGPCDATILQPCSAANRDFAASHFQ